MMNTITACKVGVKLASAMSGALVGEALTDKLINDGMYKKFLKYQKSNEYKKLSDEEKEKKVKRYNTKATLSHAYISAVSQLLFASGADALCGALAKDSSENSINGCYYNNGVVGNITFSTGQLIHDVL